MTVKSTKYGIIHSIASCDECEWSDSIKTDEPNRMQKLRSRVYAHVNKTGHPVTVESANAIKYERVAG